MLRPQPGANIYQRLAPEREEDIPPEACTRERGGCSTKDSLAGLDPGVFFPPTMTLALDVIIQSLDVTQLRYPA
jgi:hypothetical protein